MRQQTVGVAGYGGHTPPERPVLSSTVLLEISWVADKAVGRFPDAEGVYGLRCMFHVAGPHQVLPLILQQRLFSQAARDAPNFYNLGPGTGAADNFDVAPGHT